MRVTVIPEDHWIRCDNKSANIIPWPFEDTHIHAIQWYGEYGEVEYTGIPKPQNSVIASAELITPYVDQLNDFIASQQVQELSPALIVPPVDPPTDTTI